MKKYLSILLITIFISANCQDLYFPSKGNWEAKLPSDFNYNSDKIQKAIDFVIANQNNGDKDLRVEILKGFSTEPYHSIKGPTKKRGETNGLIIKDGYIIASWGDTKRVDMTFSVTKSYLSAVTGIAVDKNLIRSEKDFVSNYVWDKTFDGEKNSLITWEHLLNQSSDWFGNLFGINHWEDRPDISKSIDLKRDVTHVNVTHQTHINFHHTLGSKNTVVLEASDEPIARLWYNVAHSIRDAVKAGATSAHDDGFIHIS